MVGALALALLALSTPVGADHAWTTTSCYPWESIHWYVADPPAPSTQVVRSSGWSATVVPIDMCQARLGFSDGEHEGGFGGSVFPAGTSPCSWNAHHAYGVGAQYWAVDDYDRSVVYAAGADGPALAPDPTNPCATDGIISDDPATDPLDCGSGGLGYSPGFRWIPATLGETVAGSGACNPFDGYVVVAVFVGAGPWNGQTVVSTPVQGDIWS